MKQHIPWYTSKEQPNDHQLKQRLFDIEKERRNLSLKLEDKIRTLEDKLLGLINKHDQLDVYKKISDSSKRV
jgi:hypothetical protein